MRPPGDALPRSRPRAPAEDGGTLIEPPLTSVERLLAGNQRAWQACRRDIGGVPLPELVRQARGELLAVATAHTRAYRDIDVPPAEGRIVLAGHQPQMFHVGVWAKHFVLSDLARRHNATAINLVIDNDTLKSASLRVPGGLITAPTARAIEFDAARPEAPHEDRPIADRGLFASFGQRAGDEIASLVADPLLREYWPLVVDRSRATDNLGACLAQARHQLEASFGLTTLEVPQGRLCDQPAFRRFALHLLAELPRFRQIYNQSLAEFRLTNRVRNARHPAPDLTVDDDWQEAPFWIWRADQPRRRALFTRRVAGELHLSDRGSIRERVPFKNDGISEPTFEALEELANRGLRLRTRALTTTMWARLALGDLFVHGIGGAKYDEVTDLLIERWLEVAPPAYLTVSATLLLPIERPRVTPDDLRRVRRDARELTYHPESWLNRMPTVDNPPPWSALLAQKRAAIATEPTPSTSKQRCRTIRQANASLQFWLADERSRIDRESAEISERLRREAILGSREWAFCLYPRDRLRDFLLEIGPTNA
jgi:hypothetical protein